MKTYLDMMRHVLTHGSPKTDRRIWVADAI
jgi:hypothetical protein